MAKHKSAKKQHKQSLLRAARNRMIKSKIKTFIKKVNVALSDKNFEQAVKFFRIAESEVMKAIKKNILKLNNGIRIISSLAKKIKILEKEIHV